MKYLKEYYNYDNDVSKKCRQYSIHNWSIRDGLVDVDGSVDLSSRNLSKLPIIFGRVSGYFSCYSNQLTTIEGAPKWVGSGFYCYSNQLTTLEGAPELVDGGFSCSHNKLTTLEGAPELVDGNFNCFYNQLTTLEGAPNWVGGNFYCYENKLTTLEGAPISVIGDFSCSSNELTTLEHFPNVNGDIHIDDNPLPKEIYDNVKQLKQIIELQDDYDIWRDGKLYLPRFRELLKDIN